MELAVGPTQYLAFFWAIAVAMAFNIAYLLFVLDRKRSGVTHARMIMTILVGSLVVVGTYADALAAKPFAMKDCLLLALVAAHGWMAEELVQSFMSAAAKRQPEGSGNA